LRRGPLPRGRVVAARRRRRRGEDDREQPEPPRAHRSTSESRREASQIRVTNALRLAAVAFLGILLAGPSGPAAAGDSAPAPAAGLTDADRAFFAWWDAKGFPDVGKLPFVTLGEPEEGGVGGRESKEAEAFPAGAFLVRDDGKEVTLFLTDLHTVTAPLRT